MSKYPANRVELIQKAIIAKMLSLVLIESNDYETSLKECVVHFIKSYHADRDNTYGMLITEYQIAKFFAEYIANLSGFTDFLKSPENIESIKALTLQEIPEGIKKEVKQESKIIATKTQIMATETQEPKKNIFKEASFISDTFKAMKHFMDKKGQSFDEAIISTKEAFSKKEETKNVTREDVVSVLATKYYNTIQNMRKEPLKNIMFLVKLLSVEEKAELKGKL